MKPYSVKQEVASAIEYRKHQIAKKNSAARAQERASIEESAPSREVESLKVSRNIALKKYQMFIESTMKTFVTEGIYNIYNQSLNTIQQGESVELKKSFIENYINEEGVKNVLNKMSTGSLPLQQTYQAIKEACDKVTKSVEKIDPETLTIHPNIKDDFYEDLSNVNADEVVFAINQRVADAEAEFADENLLKKTQIDEIIKDSKEKMSGMKDEVYKEAASIAAKAKITKIKHSGTKTIYSAMTEAFLASVLKTDVLREAYLEEGNIDMGKVNDDVYLMYTFLETLNTTGLAAVNEDYLNKFIQGLK